MLVCLLLMLVCLLMRLICLLMDLFDILPGCVPPLCTWCGCICSGWCHIQAIIIGTGICCGHRNSTRWVLKTASHFVRENLLAGNIWIVTARNFVVLALWCLLHDLMLDLMLLYQLLVLLLLLLMLIYQLLLMMHCLLILCNTTSRPPNRLFTRAPCTSMVLWHFDYWLFLHLVIQSIETTFNFAFSRDFYFFVSITAA